jgi:galactokinase
MSVAHQLDQRAREAFRKKFESHPQSVVVAPGRMNIVGEHTDYNQGFVLPAAIDRHVAIALRLRRDEGVIVQSDRYQTAVALPALPETRQGSWIDYVLGVADQVRRRTGSLPGFEAAIVSELPAGSGLSSSGALEVAVAVALSQALGLEMGPLQLAELCQAAENGFVGARTGIMDQFTALQARAGNALLLDCRSLQHEQVPMPPASFSWLLANTRVHHELASSAYNQRRADCEAAASFLGVSSLREVKEGDLDRIQDPVQWERAKHVVSENARVLRAADALRRRATEELGPILYASHESLRCDFAVSCAELDCLVQLAAEVPGVLGARMMGGGFGGCVLILAQTAGLDDLEQHLAEGYGEEFRRAPEFYRVRAVDGVMPAAG